MGRGEWGVWSRARGRETLSTTRSDHGTLKAPCQAPPPPGSQIRGNAPTNITKAILYAPQPSRSRATAARGEDATSADPCGLLPRDAASSTGESPRGSGFLGALRDGLTGAELLRSAGHRRPQLVVHPRSRSPLGDGDWLIATDSGPLLSEYSSMCISMLCAAALMRLSSVPLCGSPLGPCPPDRCLAPGDWLPASLPELDTDGGPPIALRTRTGMRGPRSLTGLPVDALLASWSQPSRPPAPCAVAASSGWALPRGRSSAARWRGPRPAAATGERAVDTACESELVGPGLGLSPPRGPLPAVAGLSMLARCTRELQRLAGMSLVASVIGPLCFSLFPASDSRVRRSSGEWGPAFSREPVLMRASRGHCNAALGCAAQN